MRSVKRRIVLDPEDDDPRNNTDDTGFGPPIASAMSTSGSSSRRSKQQEVEVSNIPIKIHNPWPDTVNVRMNYYTSGDIVYTTAATTSTQLMFRLNSIYDIRVSTPATITIGTSDTADATLNQPTMRPYWANFYEYYHVIGCKYKFRIRPNDSAGSTGISTQEIVVYQYEHGRVNPPLGAGGAGLVEHQFRRMHPNLKDYKFVRHATVVTSGQTPNFMNQFVTMDGTYAEGRVEHDVTEDEQLQTWHKMTETPPERNCVSFILNKSPASRGSSATYNYTWDMTMDFIVQLKEVKEAFKYLTQSTDITAINNIGEQLN